MKMQNELKDIAGYEFVRAEDLADLQSMGYVYKHKKTGARIAVISNEDDNKVFSIGFRTPPENSTGVAHIVEHTVLCGSKEFPSKDPFVELVKGSLNTFLNAMTYPDKTMYPVASYNDKDFQNLMHVYLDAVFYPNIYKEKKIFQQEGWHYELESVEEPLTYNGVVYNEMKGAFSSPEQQLYRLIQNSLFPDTAYGVESGGDPKMIPSLTYEQYLAFHKKYYHPSNSYIYLYGDMDVEEKLRWMDEKYLSHFDYAPVDSEIHMQKAFSETREVRHVYSLSKQESKEEKTYLSYNVVVDTVLNIELYLAFQILEAVLIDSPGAPLKQAFLDRGIGKDVLSSYDNGILQPIFSVIAKNADENQKDVFVQTYKETLQKIVKEGIREDSIRAALNNMEFKYREADFGSYPKGLIIGLQMMDSWLYNEEAIFSHVLFLDTVAFLKEQIGTDYYEKLIQTYLLDNPHSSVVVVAPAYGVTEAEEERVAQELAEKKASMTQAELEQMVADTKALREYQETPSTPEELEMIPMLERGDIKKEVRPLFNDVHTYNGVELIHHNVYTNGIAYIRFTFPVEKCKQYAPYVGLVMNALGYMDTEHYTYQEFSDASNIYTGSIVSEAIIFTAVVEEKTDVLALELRTKVLYENVAKAFQLIKEMAFSTDFSDSKRLLEIIAEAKSRLEMKLNGSGHSVAVLRAASYFDDKSAFSDMSDGIGYYRFLCDLEAHFDEKKEKLLEIFQKILQYAFAKENMKISVTSDLEGLEIVKKELPIFMDGMVEKQEDNIPPVDLSYLQHDSQEGFQYAGQVQYVARAGNFKNHGFPYHGALNVLKIILGYDYLWNNIRVKGGAYGCMCGFKQDGLAYFVSYRDPKLKETNDIYEGVYDYLQKFEVSDRDMTKYMIGAIGGIDVPLNPAAVGSRSYMAYMMGLTEERLQKNRTEILEVSQQDIRDLAPLVKAFVDDGYLCVVGNEQKIEENKELFHTITGLL